MEPTRVKEARQTSQYMEGWDYDRKGSVTKKETLVMSLRRLGAKTNSLAVNRQS
jgi:hypothetical protein